MTSYQVRIPLKVEVRGGKYFTLNLNQYRNTNYFVLNKAKRIFEDEIREAIGKLPKLHNIKLHYEIFPSNKRNLDIMNFGSIADKFFCDSLVQEGVLEDDNYRIVTGVTFSFGGITKENAYALVTITNTN